MDAVVFALVAAGMGALWWRHLRVHHQAMALRQPRALGTVFDGDAEVVLHVATHEARTRGEPLTSLHILYGLLQDEQVAAALREVGRDPSALEDRVLEAMDEDKREPPRRERDDDDDDDEDESDVDDDVHRVYGSAAGHASHAGRRATPVDLWAYLRGSRATKIVETETIARVLFRLVHNCIEQDVAIDGHADVHLVLRNDDYTTRDLVCSVLQSVIGLSADDAYARMMQTHEEGRAIIGRYRPDEARAKIDEVRSRARASGFPLWIGVEPT